MRIFRLLFIVVGSVASAMLVITLFSKTDFRIYAGYKHEDGVLEEGRLVDYRSTVIKRNRQTVGLINGEWRAAQAWRISYIDENGKFGSCLYLTPTASGGLRYNIPVKCYTDELKFN